MRLIEEFKQDDVCERAILELRQVDSNGVHKWTPEELRLFKERQKLYYQLTLDYESFVVFAMMIRVARLAQLLIGRDEIPSQSFSKHKKYFLEHIPYPPNEDYARLIREQTDWYDNFLKSSRDKLILHSDRYWTGTLQSATKGIQFVKADILSGYDIKHQETMISMKQKYAGKYPELWEVQDNLWKIIEYFMSNDIKLEEKDLISFRDIVHKYGKTMPSLLHLATRIQTFLKEFSKVFDDSCQ